MAGKSPSYIQRIRLRIAESYQQIVIDSGLPGAARNPLLFITFLLREIRRSECSTRAMALSFQLLFCLVPALTLLLSLFAMLPGLSPAKDQVIEFLVDQFLPMNRELLLGQIEKFISNAELFSYVGTIILVYGAGVLVLTLNRTINAIWNIHPGRTTWFQRLGTFWVVAFLFLGGVLLSVITSGPFHTALAMLDRAPLVTPGIRSFLTSWLAGWVFIFVLYKFVPRSWVQTGSAIIAAGASSLLFSLAKVGFLAYTSWTETYTRIYGVLGALFMTLLWVYLAWLIVLAGAVAAFVLQNYLHLAGREQHKLLGERHQTFFATRLLLTVYRAAARKATPISIVDVARELGMAVYLADRLADNLTDFGLLQQVGTHNWVHLETAVPAEEITLTMVASAVAADVLEYPQDEPRPGPSSKRLRRVLREARGNLAEHLERITIADLLSEVPPAGAEE